MPVTTDTQLFALRTLNKEQLIKMIQDLRDDMEDLYDEDGVCMSSTYQELDEEHEELKEKHKELQDEFDSLETKWFLWRGQKSRWKGHFTNLTVLGSGEKEAEMSKEAISEEVEWLKQQTNDHNLIKKVFDTFYCQSLVYDLETQDWRDFGSEDITSDEE